MLLKLSPLLLASLPLALCYPAEYNNINCGGEHVLPTPTYGLKNANFSACASVKIRGSVYDVNNAILRFKDYKKWNTFIYNAVPPPGVATPRDVKVGMGIEFSSTGIPPGVNSTATDVVTFLERPFFAAWKNTMYEAYIGHSEHCFLTVPLPGGYTQFTHWQTQLGAQAGTLYPEKIYFQREFEIEARDLQQYIERK
jgi:hypothetical protein